ncbi:hypothetical protein KAS41_02980 [Candidatus Parcubacteria bacterium]|nr:hypothetical protein [Candidatus Parcubacteria bacterium]
MKAKKFFLEVEITEEGRNAYIQITTNEPYGDKEFKGSIPLDSENKEETKMKLGVALPQMFEDFKEIVFNGYSE